MHVLYNFSSLLRVDPLRVSSVWPLINHPPAACQSRRLSLFFVAFIAATPGLHFFVRGIFSLPSYYGDRRKAKERERELQPRSEAQQDTW